MNSKEKEHQELTISPFVQEIVKEMKAFQRLDGGGRQRVELALQDFANRAEERFGKKWNSHTIEAMRMD